jgi:hypothetical protein
VIGKLAPIFDDPMPRSPDASLRRPYHHRSPTGQFILRNFGEEVQVEALPLALLIRRVVEKVNDVSAKSLFDAATFVEIERTRGIHFDVGLVAQDSAQLALKSQRSLPDLGHGESGDVIRHKGSGDLVIG